MPMLLESQKRNGAVKGNTYILAPREQKSIDYKGHWCIRIVQGNVSSLKIVECRTSGGGGNDLLKMASL
jgi:hypothetical protein